MNNKYIIMYLKYCKNTQNIAKKYKIYSGIFNTFYK